MTLFRDLLIEKKRRKYYCEVEYLESTGTQYIDTGINASGNISFIFSSTQDGFDYTSAKTRFGSKVAEGNSQLAILATGGNTFRIDYGTGAQSQTNWTPSVTKKVRTFNLDANTHTVTMEYIDNTSESHTWDSSVVSFLSTYPMLIFAYNNGSTKYYASGMKVTCCKIWDGNTLVRDFIPVLDWNMTPCMYDRVTEQLFYNAGTGNFTAGREIHPVEYIESDGAQYIDTGIVGQSKYSVETEIKATSQSTAGFVFGSRIGQNSDTYACLIHNSNRIGYRVGSGGFNYTSGYDFTDKPHKIKIDNGVLYVDGSVVSTVCQGATVDTERTMLLFTIKTNTTVDATQVYRGSMYSFVIKDGDNLVRDFIPAIDENGVGYMFDRLSHTIYDNAGTGAFKYPAIEVEYLESTGTQYINTGYIPNTNTYIEMYAMYTSLDSTYRTPFSVRTSDGAANSFTISGATNTSNVYAFGSQYWAEDNGCPDASTNVKYFMSLKSGVANFNGVTGNAGTNITPTTLTAYMFARNANGTASNFFKGRIYNCLVKESSSIIRNFVPCFKDGSSGMLDKENGVFYPNAGTGTFTTGKIVEPKYE